MRKILYGLLLCLIFSTGSFSEEYRYKDLKAKITNDILDRFIEIKIWTTYDAEKDKLNIWVCDNFFATVKYELKTKQREQIREIISKYEEWRTKAIEQKIVLEGKKIGKPIMMAGTSFKLGDNWYKNSYGGGYLICYFISVDVDTHGMIISSDQLQSSHNEYITYKPEALCLEYEDIQILKDVLMEENIQEFSKEVIQKEQIQNEFK